MKGLTIFFIIFLITQQSFSDASTDDKSLITQYKVQFERTLTMDSASGQQLAAQLQLLELEEPLRNSLSPNELQQLKSEILENYSNKLQLQSRKSDITGFYNNLEKQIDSIQSIDELKAALKQIDVLKSGFSENYKTTVQELMTLNLNLVIDIHKGEDTFHKAMLSFAAASFTEDIHQRKWFQNKFLTNYVSYFKIIAPIELYTSTLAYDNFGKKSQRFVKQQSELLEKFVIALQLNKNNNPFLQIENKRPIEFPKNGIFLNNIRNMFNNPHLLGRLVGVTALAGGFTMIAGVLAFDIQQNSNHILWAHWAGIALLGYTTLYDYKNTYANASLANPIKLVNKTLVKCNRLLESMIKP